MVLNYVTVTRHLCGNPCCVNPDHLCFGTRSENSIDALNHGFKRAKLAPEKVREIRANPLNLTVHQFAAQYSISSHVIRNVTRGSTWSHVV